VTTCAACDKPREWRSPNALLTFRRRKKRMFTILDHKEVWLCDNCRNKDSIRELITRVRLVLTRAGILLGNFQRSGFRGGKARNGMRHRKYSSQANARVAAMLPVG
jgi:hypothetical protein